MQKTVSWRQTQLLILFVGSKINNFFFQGAYGTVYKARDRKNADQIVALKKVRVALTEDGIPMNTLREIALLKQLETFKHPNIVK